MQLTGSRNFLAMMSQRSMLRRPVSMVPGTSIRWSALLNSSRVTCGTASHNWDKLLENINSANAAGMEDGTFVFKDDPDNTNNTGANDGGWILWPATPGKTGADRSRPDAKEDFREITQGALC